MNIENSELKIFDSLINNPKSADVVLIVANGTEFFAHLNIIALKWILQIIWFWIFYITVAGKGAKRGGIFLPLTKTKKSKKMSAFNICTSLPQRVIDNLRNNGAEIRDACEIIVINVLDPQPIQIYNDFLKTTRK